MPGWEAEQLVGPVETTSCKTGRKQPRKDRDLQALEEELAEILGTAVTIKSARNGRGKLTIDYASLDQLDIVLKKSRGRVAHPAMTYKPTLTPTRPSKYHRQAGSLLFASRPRRRL